MANTLAEECGRLEALNREMLIALKEAETVIKAQNNGNCLASVLSAIAKAEKGA